MAGVAGRERVVEADRVEDGVDWRERGERTAAEEEAEEAEEAEDAVDVAEEAVETR